MGVIQTERQFRERAGEGVTEKANNNEQYSACVITRILIRNLPTRGRHPGQEIRWSLKSYRNYFCNLSLGNKIKTLIEEA